MLLLLMFRVITCCFLTCGTLLLPPLPPANPNAVTVDVDDEKSLQMLPLLGSIRLRPLKREQNETTARLTLESEAAKQSRTFAAAAKRRRRWREFI